MITETKGDLFSHMDEFDAIAHGCNCRGLMGAGVAKIVRNRYPQGMYRWYARECEAGNFNPGDVMMWYTPKLPILFNLATQYKPGQDASIENIQKCFERLYILMDCMEIYDLAIPRIGCGIGGLSWWDVKKAIHCPPEFNLRVYYL